MITSRARQRQEALQGQPWAGRLVSVSVALPLGQAPIPDSPLPSCPHCPAAEGHGTPHGVQGAKCSCGCALGSGGRNGNGDCSAAVLTNQN